MASVVLLTAFLICQVHSQICGPGPIFPGPWGLDPYGPCCDPYGPGILPNVQPICPAQLPCGSLNFIPNQIPPCPNFINQPLLPCSQQLITEIPVPSIIANPAPCGPVSSSPIVATTIVDNSLANSLANAIQLLIVSNLIENTLGASNGASIAQCLDIPEIPCVNNFDLITTDYFPTPVISCDCPCNNPFPNFEVPCYQEPIIYQPCIDPCNGFGPYPGIVDMPFGYDNCGPNFAIGLDNCGNPYGVPYGCADMVIAPVAVEVPFPASIPAQLLCNFGYMPSSNIPCVSVNVEPVSCIDGCNNLFGNSLYY